MVCYIIDQSAAVTADSKCDFTQLWLMTVKTLTSVIKPTYYKQMLHHLWASLQPNVNWYRCRHKAEWQNEHIKLI